MEWHWGAIPAQPVTATARRKLRHDESCVLKTLQDTQKGLCAACRVTVKAGLRGHRLAAKKWIGVCPLCHAALDWSRAPVESRLIYLPEYDPPKLNRILNTLLLWMHDPNQDRMDTGDIVFDRLIERGFHAEKLLGTSPLTPKGFCQAYWALEPDLRIQLTRLREQLRLVIFPEGIKQTLKYWEKEVYPGVRRSLESASEDKQQGVRA